MPSPTIPCSSLAPFLSSSSSSSKTRIPPSNSSACTAGSSKSPYWLAWSNINKLGSLIIAGRKSFDSLSKHSDLTEESLEAHNRRQEANILRSQNINYDINRDDKNAKCSPYYKGLIDASLAISRERHHLPSSPGHDSHATTATNNSLSSFILKMQEWSSCFSFSSKSGSTSTNKDKENINFNRPHCSSSSLSSSTANIKLNVLPVADEKLVLRDSSRPPAESIASLPLPSAIQDHTNINHGEKPLRERVSESKPQSPPPSPQNIERAATSTDDDKDRTLDMVTGREFMWANKHRPKALKDFICNRNTAIQLQSQMGDIIDFNHFIFEGPAGVGKRTMISAMLQEAFGPQKVQTKEVCKTFNLKGESIGSIQVRMKISSQHVEVNLSDLKGYEKHVIVELIKETHSSISNKILQPKHDNCRVIVLYDADKLSTDAVLYIKWLLERYKGFSKFFFCCCDVSKLQPIKMLCTVVQLSPPSNKEVVKVLEFIAQEEGIELPHLLAQKIADNSKNNLRQAIRSFEASWRRSYPFTDDQVILTGWEDDIANMAKNMIEEQSPKQLYIIRGKLQNLIEHDVSPDFIFETLVGELKRQLDDACHIQVDGLYKDYSKNDGNRIEYEDQLFFPQSHHEETGKRLNDPARKKAQHFMKIEEFIAKFMSCYKLSVTNKKACEVFTVPINSNESQGSKL